MGKINKMLQDTSLRDITDPLNRKILLKDEAWGGKKYELLSPLTR